VRGREEASYRSGFFPVAASRTVEKSQPRSRRCEPDQHSPRDYVDSVPHSVANGGITVAGLHGFNGSLRYRHISNYRLGGLDPSIRAYGLDVVDLSVSKAIRHGVEFNFAIDNLNDKKCWETQNYLES
jgi:outer membrane receptor protein involved in Fe transport